MPDPKRTPFSQILIGAAATLVRPFASAAGAVAAASSFLRGSRDPFIGASQSAALAMVDTRKWTTPLLKQLEWRRFEQLCAAYFETLGFTTRIAPSAAGGGVDIHLIEEGSDRTSIVVHGKAWDAYRIGIKAARELRSAMASANVGEGVLVTSGRFTQEAIDFAGKEGIQLIDGADLLARIAALVPEKALALLKFATQGDFLTPTCPSCSIKMISRQSTKEGRRFWGCRNYPRCKHTFSGTANAPA
jgi:restriction system protein